MYDYIQGELVAIQPLYIVVFSHGVGYRLLVANPYSWQGHLHQEIRCPVELVVREDAMTLYGFRDQDEKDLFNTLLKVSGIGPKSALSILALDDHHGLVEAIEASDVTYLVKFPGVGKKTAQQMILDLKGSVTLSSVEAPASGKGTSSPYLEEAFQALAGLGYSAKEVKKIEGAMQGQVYQSTQEALSAAFKLLRK